MKHKHITTLFLIATLILTCLTPSGSFAANPFTYTVKLQQSGQGRLYWNYNQKGNFFFNGSDTYDKACLAENIAYRFVILPERCLIAEPSEGWYFDGFRDSQGHTLKLDKQRVDVIRITIKGARFYDSVVSYSDPRFKNVTKSHYKATIKATLKALYGTTRYKIMETLDVYKVPKKTQTIQACFREKKPPVLNVPETLQKEFNDAPFYAIESLPVDYNAVFHTSSSRLLTVDSKTGLCSIKGEGIAVISVTVDSTRETSRGQWNIRVYIYPGKVNLTSAIRSKDKKSITVKWKSDTLCSGYEIQAAADHSFSKIAAKKTVASGKTSSTKVKTAKAANCQYLRIRAYKKSRNEMLYGNWIQIPVK